MSHILDISRLVSRAHLPFDTGIDRVERAFVLDTLERFDKPYFLARVGKNIVFLNAKSMREFLEMEKTDNWPHARGADMFRFKIPLKQRRVRSGLRGLAKATCRLESLQKTIALMGVDLFEYTNVGHTNLSTVFLHTMRSAGAVRISCFVHDLIPLDFPQYCRLDRLAPFKKNMQNVSDYSDRIYCNSLYTAERFMAHFPDASLPTIAHLANPTNDPKSVTPTRISEKPTFAMLGTIEPRKNLSFLLDVWECLQGLLDKNKMPTLLIIGKRGWEDTLVFERAVQAPHVVECNSLTDKQVLDHLAGCAALLFPSHAEGYGLPAQEAVALGLTVIASDIPVFNELFADNATLLPTDDPQLWAAEIISNINGQTKPLVSQDLSAKIGTWDEFFTQLYSKVNSE